MPCHVRCNNTYNKSESQHLIMTIIRMIIRMTIIRMIMTIVPRHRDESSWWKYREPIWTATISGLFPRIRTRKKRILPPHTMLLVQ